MNRQRTVAILVYPDVEILDFCGPYEVFSVARKGADESPFNVVTFAPGEGPVRTVNGLSVLPDFTISEGPEGVDLLVVPGGVGSRAQLNALETLEWIRKTAASAELVMSVCTGALLLGKTGLLDGLDATSHHTTFDLLEEVAPKARVCRDQRVIDNGKVIVSGGISAGIDMSLHVVERLLGEDAARGTAKEMEYRWRDVTWG